MADILGVTGSDYTDGSIERGESSVQLNTGLFVESITLAIKYQN